MSHLQLSSSGLSNPEQYFKTEYDNVDYVYKIYIHNQKLRVKVLK